MSVCQKRTNRQRQDASNTTRKRNVRLSDNHSYRLLDNQDLVSETDRGLVWYSAEELQDFRIQACALASVAEADVECWRGLEPYKGRNAAIKRQMHVTYVLQVQREVAADAANDEQQQQQQQDWSCRISLLAAARSRNDGERARISALKDFIDALAIHEDELGFPIKRSDSFRSTTTTIVAPRRETASARTA